MALQQQDNEMRKLREEQDREHNEQELLNIETLLRKEKEKFERLKNEISENIKNQIALNEEEFKRTLGKYEEQLLEEKIKTLKEEQESERL